MRDIEDEYGGKTEKFLSSMTHRRRKSEGHIDQNFDQVYHKL